jgi:hypothetical protein
MESSYLRGALPVVIDDGTPLDLVEEILPSFSYACAIRNNPDIPSPGSRELWCWGAGVPVEEYWGETSDPLIKKTPQSYWWRWHEATVANLVPTKFRYGRKIENCIP